MFVLEQYSSNKFSVNECRPKIFPQRKKANYVNNLNTSTASIQNITLEGPRAWSHAIAPFSGFYCILDPEEAFSSLKLLKLLVVLCGYYCNFLECNVMTLVWQPCI